MSKEDLLFQIADHQQGYFTSSQARECGYHDSNFQRYLATGEWVKIEWGLYRLGRYPLADRPDLIEWSLWSRNKHGEVQGVWSHETALDLYELCDIMPAKLHMTVPKNFRRKTAFPPILKIYFCNLQPVDWVEQQGYRLTTPMRTLLDLAKTRQIADELIRQAVLEGRKRGLILKQQIDNLPDSAEGQLIKKLHDKK